LKSFLNGILPLRLEAYDKYWDAIQVEKTVAGDTRRAGLAEGTAIGLKKAKKKAAIKKPKKLPK
jgi:hypothetical protein